ncbi:Uncharacterised protein [Mycobacteroides abscessus subsp. abscessus]|nr:Uncharacterised protein [Mycobacteroides abscessus subsp. abscessus]SIN13722.1 Uncharacterised protein [Mycobacteroides abscessus subsp. abscessus]
MTLPTCCLPGCVQVVSEWGQACQTCISECGHFLQHVSSGVAAAPEQLAEVFAERDRGTRAAYAAQAESDIALASESGASLRAAGWRVVAVRPTREGWDAPGRPRVDKTQNGVERTLWEAV